MPSFYTILIPDEASVSHKTTLPNEVSISHNFRVKPLFHTRQLSGEASFHTRQLPDEASVSHKTTLSDEASHTG
ncbi:hypothetical protein BgiBS90_006986 [Biomphalaria glabrata]|nr:hypothetical protein BgiBS90_006986 [Biomphalaria glabrata]